MSDPSTPNDTELPQPNDINEHVNDPLPEYTLNWGLHLSRPQKLPDSYDNRIDSSHIFVFAVHPVSGIERPFFVTPRPCENCAKIRQVCSRTRPACKRCNVAGRECIVADGWVKLSGPKCEKPKLKKNKEKEKEDERMAKKVKLSHPIAGPSSMQPANRELKPRPTTDHSDGPSILAPCTWNGSGPPTSPSISAPMSSTKNSPLIRSPVLSGKKGKAKASARKQGVSPEVAEFDNNKSILQKVATRKLSGRGRGRGRGRRGGSAGRNVSGRAKGKGSKGQSEDSNQDGTWVASDGKRWRAVTPPPYVPSTSSSIGKAPPHEAPRIWASSKSDLHEIIPALSTKMRNRIFFDDASLEPPIMFIEEKQGWPEDKWEDKENGILNLSIVREFTTIPQTPVPIDFEDDAGDGMNIVEEIEDDMSPSPNSSREASPVPRFSPLPHTYPESTSSSLHVSSMLKSQPPWSTPYSYRAPTYQEDRQYMTHAVSSLRSTVHESPPNTHISDSPYVGPSKLTGAFGRQVEPFRMYEHEHYSHQPPPQEQPSLTYLPSHSSSENGLRAPVLSLVEGSYILPPPVSTHDAISHGDSHDSKYQRAASVSSASGSASGADRRSRGWASDADAAGDKDREVTPPTSLPYPSSSPRAAPSLCSSPPQDIQSALAEGRLQPPYRSSVHSDEQKEVSTTGQDAEVSLKDSIQGSETGLTNGGFHELGNNLDFLTERLASAPRNAALKASWETMAKSLSTSPTPPLTKTSKHSSPIPQVAGTSNPAESRPDNQGISIAKANSSDAIQLLASVATESEKEPSTAKANSPDAIQLLASVATESGKEPSIAKANSPDAIQLLASVATESEKEPILNQEDSSSIDPLPLELPPEIQHLLNCNNFGIPISLVVSRDWELLPFTLIDTNHAIIFLGFFSIQELKHRIVDSRIETNGVETKRVIWNLRLHWVPGRESGNSKATLRWNPRWLPLSAEPPAEPPEVLPYALLPAYLCSDDEASEPAPSVASEVHIRKGWHCPKCGRLNVQRFLCFQTCSTDSCGAGNGMKPVGVMYVRDPHAMGLSAHPADRIPEGVHSQTYDLPLFGSREDGEIPDGMRTFVYTANNPGSPVIKHIYTCNRPSMQVEPNYLFRDLQLFVHLQWQKAATKLAIGPYFTYLAGFGHEGESTPDPWNKVPVCITRAREFMQNLGRRSGQYEAFTVDQLTVLAWHNTGSRKGSPFPARDTPVAILCLGADVEFSLSPRAGFPPVEVSMQLGQSPRRNLKASKVKYEVKDLADSDDDDDDEEPLFTRLGHTRSVSNSALVKASAKRKRQSELLLTLVHGDMLMLSGDEFEWVLKRTGMSIILIGLQSERENH